MSKRQWSEGDPIPSLESISIAPTASAMRWDFEPLPREEYDSDLDMVVDVTIESRSYRELFQVALEKLADLQKRLQNSQRAQRAMKDYRTRERSRHDVHR